jgi:epoxyqueuosine reductase
MNFSPGLVDLIKAEARNRGFSLFGITKPVPPPHIHIYEKWIADKRFADMAYLARQDARLRRANPGTNLDGCRSILVLGFPYPGPSFIPRLNDDQPYGRIASYAIGNDYHLCASQQAEKMIEYIRSFHRSLNARIYVDTGPILERDLAQMAGLGWIGKNTCLITPQQGSFFFLVNIFTDLILEPAPPFLPDRCGICHKCIDACPTHCILADRTIDAQRCISYLTIENKSAIPLELRPLIGNWLFGCDICQIACPWNKMHLRQAGDPSLIPREYFAYPPLLKSLSLTDAEFSSTFRHSPILRTHRRGYVRNIAVVLGNQPAPDHLPHLKNALEHETDRMLRAHFFWAIGQLRTSAAKETLAKYARIETDPQIITEIAYSLDNI